MFYFGKKSRSFSYPPTKSSFFLLYINFSGNWKKTLVISWTGWFLQLPSQWPAQGPCILESRRGRYVWFWWLRLPAAPYPRGQGQASALPSTLTDALASGDSPVQVPSEKALFSTFHHQALELCWELRNSFYDGMVNSVRNDLPYVLWEIEAVLIAGSGKPSPWPQPPAQDAADEWPALPPYSPLCVTS